MTVFVDSGFYIARLSARDQWHRAALDAVQPGMRFVTSSSVLNETITLLQKRGYLSAALQFLAAIQRQPEVEIVHADALIHSDSWDLFHKFAGAGATAVDCVSFAIMKSRRIRRAFTFDEHFRTAGFQILGK